MASMGSAHARSPLTIWMGWAGGFALAIVACGGILAQRVSKGDVRAALVAHVFLTIAVLLVARVAPHHHHRSARTAQLVGAAAGIAVAHYVVHASPLAAIPWLSERPAQLVNDAVAVFGPLAIIWASSRRLHTTAVVATLLLVTAYRATASHWHVDGGGGVSGGVFPTTFSVQDFVTGEFAGSAISVALFRLLTSTLSPRARC